MGFGRHTMRSLALWLLFAVATFLPLSWPVASFQFEIQPKQWIYQSKHEIGYEVATAQANDNDTEPSEAAPILLLNGFGVGSFHQHRLVPELLRDTNDAARQRTVYCLDYLGQGRSWPIGCNDGKSENEADLQYSAETWCNQIIDFLETIVLPHHADGKKVHLVGNSVGGYLAAHVACRRPDLVASLCLLNPTPVWGGRLPGWDGHLPAPAIPKAVGRYLFDRIRDLNTIERFLEATYSNREGFDDELMRQIRGCTLGDGGHAAFASIMWSPPLVSEVQVNGEPRSVMFNECLEHVKCDVLLVFGKDDPWCKPVYAKKMLRALEERTSGAVHRYVEVSHAGHCPNHEAPQAVGHLVRRWVGAQGSRSKKLLDLTQQPPPSAESSSQTKRRSMSFAEEWGSMRIRERKREDIQAGWVDRIVAYVL